MARQVRWTENAAEDLEQLIQYLKKEWSAESAYKFVRKLFIKIEIISHLPHAGARSEKMPEIRRILITSHTSLYYSFDEKTIIILNIFDNRRNPHESIF